MRLIEQVGKLTAERTQLVEKADTTDAHRIVTSFLESGDDIGRVKNASLFARGFASREASGKESRMFSWLCGSGQKASEERLMGCVGKVPRRMPQLPATVRENACKVWRLP